jgi:hypothetical protein
MDTRSELRPGDSPASPYPLPPVVRRGNRGALIGRFIGLDHGVGHLVSMTALGKQ